MSTANGTCGPQPGLSPAEVQAILSAHRDLAACPVCGARMKITTDDDGELCVEGPCQCTRLDVASALARRSALAPAAAKPLDVNDAHRKGVLDISARVPIPTPSARTSAYGGEGPRRTTEEAKRATEEPWPEPRPIVDDLLPVDALSDKMLPGSLAGWLGDISDRMQVPPEFGASAAIVGIGSLLSGRCVIRPKRHDDWKVDPNLWGAAVGEPGLMKSPAASEALRPLRRLVVEAHEQHDADQKTWEAEQEVAKVRAELRKKRLKTALANEDAEEVEKLKAELAQGEERLPPPHAYVINDATTEKLIEMARINPRGAMLFRDELSGFFSYLERDGHENDRALYTEAWEPKPYRQDRIGRGSVYVPWLGISVYGTIQPGPLFRHIRAALKTGDGADGFVQRFQVLVHPDVNSEWRHVDRYPDTDLKNAAFRLFKAIDSIQPKDLGAVLDEGDRLPHFRFDDAGQEVFDAWLSELERRKVRNPNVSPALRGHLSKYRKLMPALALIFEVAERVENTRGPGRVGAKSALLAAEWTRLLEQHARRIYAAATNGDAAGARVLADKLRSGALKDGFRARDVYRHQWSGLAGKDETDAALAMLIDLGWLREERLAPGNGGGRPVEVFRVNPALRGSVSNGSALTSRSTSPRQGGFVSNGSLGGPLFSSSSSSGGDVSENHRREWPAETDETSGDSEAGDDLTKPNSGAPPHDPATGEVLV